MRALILLCTLLCPTALFLQDDTPPPPGALVVVGGGGTPEAVLIEGLGLTGKADPVVVILPQASEAEDRGKASAEMFRQLGVKTVELLDPLDEGSAQHIARADFIWFPGGDQDRLFQNLNAAGLVRPIQDRNRAGAVVGGTSAGAAIMSLVMISGPPEPRALLGMAMKPLRGLGLWPSVIVDQHFVERDRYGRLLTAVLDHPRQVGIGISEGTACIVQGSRFEVRGKGQVLVVDARKAEVPRFKEGEMQHATGLSMQVLRAGDSIDLAE